MMKLKTVFVASVAAITGLCCVSANCNSARAAVVASYTDFSGNGGSSIVSADSSLGTNWSTLYLFDQAAGTAALGQSVTGTFNRRASAAGPGSTSIPEGSASLFVSNNRENPGNGGAFDTWFDFHISPDPGFQLDFTGQVATLDTYAFSTVTTGSGGNWELLADIGSGHSTVGGIQTGATASTLGTVIHQAVSFDLSSLGVVSDIVYFRLNPIATGGTNGVTTQRSIGFDNLIINAAVSDTTVSDPNVSAVPEPGSFAIFGLSVFGLLFRRRRSSSCNRSHI
jgi:hypothetical protein